ncbi:MAG: hypothetical protein IPH06_06735 [Alphaproteobacteria bacterium]|nr:hypothetical protein [Alphaproteobacteria bacterium]QQS57712.1 MAG: hypothetical protein IPN28_02500 [Alphaproteobacteria bacterium]
MAKPIFMYHLTSAGQGDETLRSLFEHHAQTIGPEWIPEAGQRNGFFVSSSLTRTRNIGQIPPDKDMLKEMKRPKVGREIIATVECDFSEGWDIDYEDSPELAKIAFFNFAEQLEQVPPGRIVLFDGTAIQAIRAVNDATRDGLELDVVTPGQPGQETLFMPWDSPMDTPHLKNLRTLSPQRLNAYIQELKNQPRFSENALLQGLRDYLVETKGAEYRTHEEKIIRDTIASLERRAERDNPIQPQAVSLKYSGAQPLKIISMEMLGPRNRWEPVEPPPNPPEQT